MCGKHVNFIPHMQRKCDANFELSEAGKIVAWIERLNISEKIHFLASGLYNGAQNSVLEATWYALLKRRQKTRQRQTFGVACVVWFC